jgi:serine O-acetyltransferase
MSIREEIKNIMEKDPAACNVFEVLLYPSLHAILLHRVAHRLYKADVPFFPRLISQMSRFFTGIEIHPGAKIGKKFFIDHGTGVVIGETAEIGDNVTLYQGVTLGGTGKERGKRHPSVGNNVLIGVGAKVLGAITIGDNARIGGGAVVLKDVPPNTTAVGVPAKIVAYRPDPTALNQRVESLPDPEGEMLDALQTKSQELEERLSELLRNQLQAHIDETHEMEHEHEVTHELHERVDRLEERLGRIEQGVAKILLKLEPEPPLTNGNGHKHKEITKGGIASL